MEKGFRVVKGLVLVSLLAMTMTGCRSLGRSNAMQDLVTTPMPTPETAVVHFIRPTRFGGAIKFGIWDSDKFVGILEGAYRMPYETAPGEHVFLAQAENWSIVKATLKPGHNYFILGRVTPGVWRARVECDPICKGDKVRQDEIDNWMARLPARTVRPEAVEAYESRRIRKVREILKRVESGKAKARVMTAEDYR